MIEESPGLSDPEYFSEDSQIHAKVLVRLEPYAAFSSAKPVSEMKALMRKCSLPRFLTGLPWKSSRKSNPL